MFWQGIHCYGGVRTYQRNRGERQSYRIRKQQNYMIPKRLLSNEKLRKLGWTPKYDLRSGLADALKWYKENKDQFDPNSKP